MNVNQYYFVSDNDSTLQSCIFKVFSDKFRDEEAIYFTSQYEKGLTLSQAGTEAFKSRIELKRWANTKKFKAKGIWNIAKEKLKHDLMSHNFYDDKEIDGVKYPVRGNNPIKHPLPDKDEGIRWVNLISYLEVIVNEEMTNLVMEVNSRSINNFFQEVRRRISLLERPIVTARGDGKSYIYANYNPKYAQQVLTIFRTFYNFCWARKYGDIYLTPAQKLGLTDKVFNYEDIVYFR